MVTCGTSGSFGVCSVGLNLGMKTDLRKRGLLDGVGFTLVTHKAYTPGQLFANACFVSRKCYFISPQQGKRLMISAKQARWVGGGALAYLLLLLIANLIIGW
jgi:hypothetical protein